MQVYKQQKVRKTWSPSKSQDIQTSRKTHTNICMDQMTYNYDVSAGQYDDFMDEAANFQFIDLIRGEPAATHEFCVNWDCDHVVLGCPQFVPILPENIPDLHDLYEFNAIPDQNVTLNQAQPDNAAGVDEKPFPAPVCNNSTKPKTKKSDRARTLISERKRRSSMKEKLYALRSLVPYITKMDKASIIGDAIRYVQELQMKNNKLKSEVADLESPFNQLPAGAVKQQQEIPKITTMISPPIRQILQIEVFEVEARELYVRIVCNKSEGIAALLYNALDSIGLNVKTSNLATTDDQNYLFTFTLTVSREIEMDINLPELKLWIASAFCNQGFHFSALSA